MDRRRYWPSSDVDAVRTDGGRRPELIDAVVRDHGPITALILSHAHDVESGILDTTTESFDQHPAVNARASLLPIATFARQIPDGGFSARF